MLDGAAVIMDGDELPPEEFGEEHGWRSAAVKKSSRRTNASATERATACGENARGNFTVTHRNRQAVGPDPDLGPEVAPKASERELRLKAEPSPGPEIVVGPNPEAHRTRGASPGTRMAQSVSKAHPNRRCRVAPGLTGCAAEEVKR
ncbi:hypothetical protein MRX96_017585 [Rhipicephalus microplus]